MRIAFDRFVALTAALAGTGGAVSACGSDPVTHSSAGGRAGSSGNGGKGGSSAGTAGRSPGAGGDGGGRAGNGGSAGRSAGGNAGAPRGGSAGSGAMAGSGGSTAGAGNDGSGGSAGTVGQGGEAGDAMGGEAGALAEGGAGGAPNDVCLADAGISDCSGLGLPSDECNLGRNPLWRSCTYGAGDLRAGVLEGLGACLLSIVDDSCTVEADEATYACETSVAAAACPRTEAAEACANGVPLQGGGTITAPLAACTDGTLTQDNCSELLNAVTPAALAEVVRCSDPAGEYSFVSAGTCVERLHACVFPRSGFYPW